MKLLNAVIFLCFSLAVFHVTGASAENRAGAVSVSPLIGVYTFDSDQPVKNGPAYGIVLGYDITERIGIEGAFTYVDSDFRSATLSNDVNAYIYRLEGLYHFMAAKDVVPYIAVGAGAITIDIAGDAKSTGFLFNYGAGLKYFLTESLAVRAGIRHTISFEDKFHNFLYKLGLSYQIGTKAGKAPKKPVAMDSDSDGVNDDTDQCPGTPAGVVVYSTGCPLDSDKDGVHDYRDDCPGTLAGSKVDTSGCPFPVKKEVSLDMNIVFDSNSAIVKNAFHDEIKKVSDFLKSYPDATAVIEGHTDSAGDDLHNLQLSQQRAENVIRHIVEYGIHPSRLKAEGYGESRPIADNSTAEGRRKNRRVVAVIAITVEKKP